MPRTLRTLSLLLALALCGVAAAQPSVVLSADTLYYPFAPGDDAFSVTNAGADTLTLSFPSTEDLGGYEYFYGTIVGYGWDLEAETPDSLYEEFFLPFDDFGVAPQIALGPDEAAEFRILAFDPCPVCRPGGYPDDRLYLRAADATGADTVHVVLDVSGYVSNEPAPSASASVLTVFPNPARASTVVRVEGTEPAPVRVALFDVLGRRVRSLTASPDAQTRLDLRGLAPGRYVLRADFSDGTDRTRPLTILP